MTSRMHEQDAPEDVAEEAGDGAPAGRAARRLPPEGERGALAWIRRLGHRLGITNDDLAFRELYENNKQSMWSCVNGRGISEATARDLFQDLCVIVARRPGGLPDPVMPYVRDVARKLKANVYRAKRPEEPIDEGAPVSRPDQERLFAAIETVEAALASMRKKDAWLVRMVDLHGESYEDLARQLGCTPKAAQVRHSRAKGRFKVIVEELLRRGTS
jgi:RNA polymerase sigma-70 factor (ECF subfamily)